MLIKTQVQDKICELNNKIITFFNWSNKLFILYNKAKERAEDKNSFYKNPATNCLVLNNILYFKEGVLGLSSILENKSSPEEISFKYY